MNRENVIYRPNTIFWIEDMFMVFESGADYLAFNPRIVGNFGPNAKILSSEVMSAIPDAEAQSRIDDLINAAGDAAAFVNVRTAQMGRTYLEKIVPGAIICDSAFPLNGSVTIRWLQEHGMEGYPLVGFSASRFDTLPSDMRRFFTETSAVYFCKNDDRSLSDLITALIFSRDYVLLQQQKQSR